MGCKHIAGLARSIDTLYKIDDYLSVFDNIGKQVGAPMNKEFETPPD